MAAEYVQQIVQALQYIHEHNVIHRDIKPENILVDKDGVLKLADFGWSNFVKNKQTKRETYCGTLDYLAPEMVEESHQHDYRVDIWSIGVLIFELCTGLSPFSHELVQQNIISEQAVKKNIASVNFSFPQHLSADCKDLIRRILVKEP